MTLRKIDRFCAENAGGVMLTLLALWLMVLVFTSLYTQ